MWVFSTRGFYSVVRDRDDANYVLVRARVGADLERLREVLPDLRPWHDPSADYAWRARVDRREGGPAPGGTARGIDHPKIQDAGAQRPGAAPPPADGRGVGGVPGLPRGAGRGGGAPPRVPP